MALTFVKGKPTKAPSPQVKGHSAPTIPPWEDAPVGNQLQEQEPAVDQVAVSQQQAAQESVLETTQVLTADQIKMVDEYTALHAKLEALNVSPILKEMEALKKQLQSIAKSDAYDTGKVVQLFGSHKNFVEFSACANATEIVDKAGFVEKIGIGAYLDNSKTTLGDAKKLLTETELAQFTATGPGARSLKYTSDGPKGE